MTTEEIVHIVEDEADVGESLAVLLQSAGLNAQRYPSAREFLKSEPATGCVVCDVRMPGLSGLELLDEMKKRRIPLPAILMTAFADVPLAVKAMKLGAVDFIEKPFDDEIMISSVRAALALRGDGGALAARKRVENLTSREKDVLAGLLKGKLNKTIAYEIGVSVRTVETHRANLMAGQDRRAEPVRIDPDVVSGQQDRPRRLNSGAGDYCVLPAAASDAPGACTIVSQARQPTAQYSGARAERA